MDKPENEREDVFLARLMCERKGKKDNIPLGIAYWNRPEWKMFFKQQILAANSLLKIYPFQVVIAAVNNKKVNWTYSLRAPQLKQILIEENAKYERKLVIEEKRIERDEKREEIIQSETAPVIMEEAKSLRSRLD